MDDEDAMMKYAMMAAGAFILWKFVWPKFSPAGQLLARRVSEATLRRQYILDSIQDGLAVQQALPAGDPGRAEIDGRIATLNTKLAALAKDYAAANNGALIPNLDLTDPAMLTTYKSFLQSMGWKDALVGVT